MERALPTRWDCQAQLTGVKTSNHSAIQAHVVASTLKLQPVYDRYTAAIGLCTHEERSGSNGISGDVILGSKRVPLRASRT